MSWKRAGGRCCQPGVYQADMGRVGCSAGCAGSVLEAHVARNNQPPIC
jgi:hypothetical protein